MIPPVTIPASSPSPSLSAGSTTVMTYFISGLEGSRSRSNHEALKIPPSRGAGSCWYMANHQRPEPESLRFCSHSDTVRPRVETSHSPGALPSGSLSIAWAGMDRRVHSGVVFSLSILSRWPVRSSSCHRV
jgi:hypothetical protein